MGGFDQFQGRHDADADVGEAELRKARSIARLESETVPVLASLPLIETEEESTRRGTSDVAWRALALAVVAVKGEGHSQAEPEEVMTFTQDLIERFDLDHAFTPAERRFVEDSRPTDRDWIQFTWRYECYWTLLWALGFVESLGKPTELCDPAVAMQIMRDLGKDRFLERAELRPQSELLDAADLIYRYHWAVVDARLRGTSLPGLDPGVVLERHYALNWLIGYMDQPWDEISTDT